MSKDAKPHYIDLQRTIKPIDTPITAPGDYGEVLRSDFVSSYSEGRDVWTEEAAMQQACAILHTHLGHPSDVLDVGAGRGRDAGFLLAQGHRVSVVDLVELPEWAQLAQNWGDQLKFSVMPVTELGGEALFDGVLDNGCLHHQHPDDYAAYLQHIYRLLRPNGLFTVSVFESKEPGRLYANQAQRLYREFTDSELTELLFATNFTPVSVHWVPRPMVGLSYLVLTVRKVCLD